MSEPAATARRAGGLVVRQARDEELTAVGALTVAAYEPFLLGPDDPYARRLGDAAARAREAELWVCVDDAHGGPDARPLGTLTWCPPGSPWCELARDGEGEFRMLAVDPAAQGRGVGAALVDAALARARREGLERLVLSSLTDMEGAHRLYRRAGFERVPARDWRPLPDVVLVCFARELA